VTRLEDRLRELPSGFGGSQDADAALEVVLARGSRKRLGRVAGGVGIATAAIALVAVAAVAGWSPPVPRIDPVGPADPSADASTTPRTTVEPSATPAPESSASAVAPVSPRPDASEPASPHPDDEPVIDPPPPDPLLELSVTTDRDRYAVGAPVTITIEACNVDDEPHDEFFVEEGNRYTVRVLTREDRRAVADTSGRAYDGGDTTETWQPGECRSWTEVWDQTEGRFDEPGGQQAEPGQYTVQLDWHGVEPPPPGMDPGLYDPPGRGGAAESDPFAIEPTSQPSPTLLPAAAPRSDPSAMSELSAARSPT